mgnify:CR=1 FL=1
MNFIKRFSFALTFLTRIPFPLKTEYNDQLPSSSMGLYPLIGLIIGVILIVFSELSIIFLTKSITNILMLILLVYLTGGLHLDGFIDSIDGLFSCRKKDKILEIMHDSLIGSFGAIAVILLFLLKFNLFLELTGNFRIPVILLMAIISRWMIVFAAWKYPLAVSSSLGKGFNYNLSWKQLFEGSTYLIILIFSLHYLFSFPFYLSLIIFLISLLVTHLFSKYVISKIDGLTGDIYGAINEIIEVLVLLTALILKGVL